MTPAPVVTATLRDLDRQHLLDRKRIASAICNRVRVDPRVSLAAMPWRVQ